MTCQNHHRDNGSPLRWTLLALVVIVHAANAAPQTPKVPEPVTVDDVVYDQRQNGSENVRISLSDLKVVLAPADGLFEIMSMAGAQLLNSQMASAFSSDASADQYLNSQLAAELANADSAHRPASVPECIDSKCNNRHRQAAKKNRYKLSNFIAPLLNNQVAKQKIAETESSNNNNN